MAGQRSCYGVFVCMASSAAGAPSNPSHKHFLAVPSPPCRGGAVGSGRSCQRGKSLSQDLCGVMKTSNPPAYHLPSHRGNCWFTALTAGSRKLLISSLKSSGSFAHPPSSLASSLPARDYCRTLSFRMLVQAWCCCSHPPCHFLGHNPCGGGICSPAKEGGQ